MHYSELSQNLEMSKESGLYPRVRDTLYLVPRAFHQPSLTKERAREPNVTFAIHFHVLLWRFREPLDRPSSATGPSQNVLTIFLHLQPICLGELECCLGISFLCAVWRRHLSL